MLSITALPKVTTPTQKSTRVFSSYQLGQQLQFSRSFAQPKLVMLRVSSEQRSFSQNIFLFDLSPQRRRLHLPRLFLATSNPSHLHRPPVQSFTTASPQEVGNACRIS